MNIVIGCRISNAFNIEVIMKYLALFLTLCLSIYTSLYAQNEQIGNVKTRGRLTSEGSVVPGTPIDGAAVILKGGNATVSGRNGDFAVMTQNDKFYINEVKKPGYELVDAEILKKEYFVSKNPLIIVLETPDQMLKDADGDGIYTGKFNCTANDELEFKVVGDGDFFAWNLQLCMGNPDTTWSDNQSQFRGDFKLTLKFPERFCDISSAGCEGITLTSGTQKCIGRYFSTVQNKIC
jgi:hypothetical protein